MRDSRGGGETLLRGTERRQLLETPCGASAAEAGGGGGQFSQGRVSSRSF